MSTPLLQAKAESLRSLHSGGILPLAEVWDVPSATIVERAGARALGTSAPAMAWAVGRPFSGIDVRREELCLALAGVTSGSDLPVSADLGDGLGAWPDDVAETVAQAIRAGAAGVDLADSGHGVLRDGDEQVARIRGAREGAARAGLPGLFVNARIDVFLNGVGF